MHKNITLGGKNMREKGFTLIELLVVIVILGILAAVVVFAVGNLTDNAAKNACQIEVREANTAIEAFRAQGTAYPTAGEWNAGLPNLNKVPGTAGTATAAYGGAYNAGTHTFSAACPS